MLLLQRAPLTPSMFIVFSKVNHRSSLFSFGALVYGHNTGKSFDLKLKKKRKAKFCFVGIIYNNQMDDFSQPGLSNYYGYAPSPANFIKPCKNFLRFEFVKKIFVFSQTSNVFNESNSRHRFEWRYYFHGRWFRWKSNHLVSLSSRHLQSLAGQEHPRCRWHASSSPAIDPVRARTRKTFSSRTFVSLPQKLRISLI